MTSPRFQKSAASPTNSGPGPRILLSGGRVVYLGPGLDLSPHKNVAVTVAVGLERPFDFAQGDSGLDDVKPHRVALIPSGTMHKLTARGAMAFVYLDALSDDYAQLDVRQLESASADLSAQLAARLAGGLATDDTPRTPAQDVHTVFETLGIQGGPRARRRLSDTIRAIDRQPQCFPRIEEAAQHAGLSVSRFQHVFREEAGMPFRRYRLWRRMAVVAAALHAGRSLTEAAFEAGFASSAHLSATFRTMFGVTPSGLLALGTRFEIAPDEVSPVVDP